MSMRYFLSHSDSVAMKEADRFLKILRMCQIGNAMSFLLVTNIHLGYFALVMKTLKITLKVILMFKLFLLFVTKLQIQHCISVLFK